MFNRGGFNQIAFNREYSTDIFMSSYLSGKGEMICTTKMEFVMSVNMSGEGDLLMNTIREIFISSQMDGIGEMSMNNIRERLIAASLNGIGEIDVNFSKYHVDSIGYSGDFGAGEKIVIDMKKMTFKKDGMNAINDMTGDFFDLNPGVNELVYTDEESGRSILFRITHKDKYLY